MDKLVRIAITTGFLMTGVTGQNLAQPEHTVQLSSPELVLAINGQDPDFSYEWTTKQLEDGLSTIHLKIMGAGTKPIPPLTIRWKIPDVDVKGTWHPNAYLNKSIHPDWASDNVQSRAAVDAPVISLFSNDDTNVHTFALSDALNTVKLHAGLHEEKSEIHCSVKLFTERSGAAREYQTSIRVDSRDIRFDQALGEVSEWWTTFAHLKPLDTPDLALLPMYSTWYSYHQSLDTEKLLEECRLAYQMGYRAIIIDDGWQTTDNDRGYAFAGDWRPERIPDMKGFVEKVHATGMKLLLWYSVPLIGEQSDAYQRFKGKFLTENQGWGATVVDPRYPEVRQYLIDVYVRALVDWNLDGFKLDFIDQFKTYEHTENTIANGRDYASVNQAVDRLMSDIVSSLRSHNEKVLIEFRQRYVGPSMRKYGNMFRAGDCPNDGVTNRVRTTDVRLLCGTTAVHSDMLMWNFEEPVEIAALQFLNILYSVPQLSVRLADIPNDHKEMITFYTNYWIENKETLMKGVFEAKNPAGNYPLLSAKGSNKLIVTVYQNLVVSVKESDVIHVVNGKSSNGVVIQSPKNLGTYNLKIHNCRGEIVSSGSVSLDEGVTSINIPAAGLAILERK